MAVLGITGGIGSGKSTFSRILARLLPAEIFDADATARRLLETDSGVREAVRRDVSPLAYTPDGSADRNAIRRVVFENPGARARLEAILHPLVRSRWLQFASESRAANTHVIVDIPLLFETNAESFFDRILTVACSRENQMARIAARGLARDQIEKIIESQLPLDQKIARSDFVVWNDGTLAILEDQAAELDLNS